MDRSSALFDTGNPAWLLIDQDVSFERTPPKQLLKWVGNKQRFAKEIANVFPKEYNRYIEPFVGSGALLGAMAPHDGIAGDALKPLVEMWLILQKDPQRLYLHYKSSWDKFIEDRDNTYKKILDSYNAEPNPLDLAFISRSCYGGIVRFTKQGRMSTPIGPHTPISPESFAERINLWRHRVKNTKFIHSPFEKTMALAVEGDIIYCDPPYTDSQTILYGAQGFNLENLWISIEQCKSRGAKVALSIDGYKKSGSKEILLTAPTHLFKREFLIKGGSSMLRRFQKKDQIMSGEDVHDRLLLTW